MQKRVPERLEGAEAESNLLLLIVEVEVDVRKGAEVKSRFPKDLREPSDGGVGDVREFEGDVATGMKMSSNIFRVELGLFC